MLKSSVAAAATVVAIVAVGAVVALTGCSNGGEPTSPQPPSTTSVQSGTPPSRALSPRGNDIRKPGDTIGWKLKDGSGTITAVLDNFVVSSSCAGGGPAKNGTYLTFDLQVTTPASPAVASAGAFFHRDGYSVVGPDGITARRLWTDNTYSCVDNDTQWSDDLGPGATYKGKVVLDIPAGSTVLAFNPTANDTGGGDEWPLPTPTVTSTSGVPRTTTVAPAPTTASAPLTSGEIRLMLIDLGCSTSGCIQSWFACDDGLININAPDCAFYRSHPIK